MEINIRRAEKKDAKRLCELLETIAQLHHEGRPDIYGAGGAKYGIKDVQKKIENADEIILVAVDESDVVLGYTMSKIIDVEEKSLQLCPTLYVPIDSNPPGSIIPRIPQARTPAWVAIFFSNA